MRGPLLQAYVDAANAYKRLFVPALFQQYAPRVIEAARIQGGQRVLDVACGTGILAREAAAAAGGTGSVFGFDLAPGMLRVAASLAPDIVWCQGTVAALPYAADSFDAVISQFGLMFFPNRQQALGEMLRVLRPGGRIAVAVWDSLDHMPAYRDEVALLDRLAGSRAADALRAPFVLGDRNEVVRLFAAAGVESLSVRTEQGLARFPDIRSMVAADLRGWLPVMDVVLPEDLIHRILDEAEQVLRSYVTAETSVAFDISAHLVTGTKPR